MPKFSQTIPYGGKEILVESGELAKQATSAVKISCEGTEILVTVVAGKISSANMLPLTVDYRERAYAAGRIPGGFFKREGRPSEAEILTSRLIDRPIRPLFADGFRHETQVVATLLSLNRDVSPDILALLGTSAALAISGLPFNGPIGAARVGYRQGQYLLNPTPADLNYSSLDLVVVGTEHGVLMVESEALELTEEVMLGAVSFGHKEMQTAIRAIREFAMKTQPKAFLWEAVSLDDTHIAQIEALAATDLAAAYQIQEKASRIAEIKRIGEKVSNAFAEKVANDEVKNEAICSEIEKLEKKIVRQKILIEKSRIDGRKLNEVRPIEVKMQVLERTHGSALFTRGETQVLAITTLGSKRDAQLIDAIDGEYTDPFMVHYNFPPFSVGETGQMSSPKRREIGHGALAKRALKAVLPSQEEFPYVIRVVCETLECNGSSSQATVCAASLALMGAGVPLTAPVAGIAMGLIKEADQYVVLSDILSDEDRLGDKDLKVAGTAKGVTALQMDLKIDSINETIMFEALMQAKEGRLHILNIMNQVCPSPRPTLSSYAPRILTMTVPTEKIKDVIGKGGATIRGLIEETGAAIDIEDDGTIKIVAANQEAATEAMKKIAELIADVEIDRVYQGKVVKLADFGAFVSILPGREGLLHISQISNEHVENVADFLSEGQTIQVKVVAIDRQGRIRLSMREVE